MKINNRGYLLVEIIVASVLAMTLTYFLVEITINLKNINEDYYVETKLETDQILMIRDVMNDISNNTLVSVTTTGNIVDFSFKDSSENEFKTRITIDNNTFKYGKINSSNNYDNSVYINTFDKNLDVKSLTIDNLCYTNNQYKKCSQVDVNTINKGLLQIKIPATTIFDENDYGLNLSIPYNYRTINIITTPPTIKLECSTLNAKITIPDFNNPATTDEGLFLTKDNFGDTCYYRGAVTNNYLEFGGALFRIVRINGNGSIKIIYNDDIGTSKFNTKKDANTHVGFMYSSYAFMDAYTTYAQTHRNDNNSTIKTTLETWYNNFINSSNIGYIDQNTTYCNDRSIYDGLCRGTVFTCKYASYGRLFTKKSPSLTCTNSNDAFNKVGLITADEVSMAGAVYNISNDKYYLYTGNSYWTMSPFDYTNCGASVWTVADNGSLNVTTSGSTGIGVSCSGNANSSYAVRPVISLKAGLEFEGDGSKSNPYKIKVS